MTDNEIIKALECCSSPRVNACDDCPFYERCYNNNEWLEDEAVDLINRQKAEIERQREHIELLDIEHEAIKVSAIKEFAERLKEYVESYDVTTGYKITIVNAVEEETIDNLVKEMVGDSE